MSIDSEQIEKALSHFENDEYVEAKEILQGQIRQHKEDFLKSKLKLEKPIFDKE